MELVDEREKDPQLPQLNRGRIVRRFGARHPACEVTFVNTGLDENPLAWLRTGRVDLLATRLPITQPDVTVGPVLSREPRVLLVSRSDPLADRAEIDYDEIGDRPVSDLPTFPSEMMDAYIPPVTSSGRRLRRIVSRTTEEAMMRVAVGEQVHPTVKGWLDHHTHPGTRKDTNDRNHTNRAIDRQARQPRLTEGDPDGKRDAP